MMEVEAPATLRAPETFTSVYDGWHGMLPEATHGSRCFACYGSAVQGTMLQAVAFGSVHLVHGSSKDHLRFPPVFLGVNQMSKFELETKQETIWGPFLWSGVKLWLCLHLSPEACIRPHFPKALWLIFRDSLICTNNVEMGIVC